jgi:hypothetical protein
MSALFTVLWGKHDLSFDLGEPERYRKDVPSAEVHAKADDIAAFVRQFMKAQK